MVGFFGRGCFAGNTVCRLVSSVDGNVAFLLPMLVGVSCDSVVGDGFLCVLCHSLETVHFLSFLIPFVSRIFVGCVATFPW